MRVSPDTVSRSPCYVSSNVKICRCWFVATAFNPAKAVSEIASLVMKNATTATMESAMIEVLAPPRISLERILELIRDGENQKDPDAPNETDPPDRV